jgi:hypothetical protein
MFLRKIISFPLGTYIKTFFYGGDHSGFPVNTKKYFAGDYSNGSMVSEKKNNIFIFT